MVKGREKNYVLHLL